MMRCEAVGSRNMRRMTPTSEVFLGRSMSEVESAFASSYSSSYTINIRRIIQVYSKNPSIRESQDQDVVGNLRGNKVGRNRELETDFLHVENGKRILVEILQAPGGCIAIGWVESHPSRRVKLPGPHGRWSSRL